LKSLQETDSGSGFSKLKSMRKSGHEKLDFIGLTKAKWKEYPLLAQGAHIFIVFY